MPLADPVNAGVRCLDVVIPLQIPDDALRPHVVCPAQVQEFFNDLFGRFVRVVLGAAPSARHGG